MRIDFHSGPQPASPAEGSRAQNAPARSRQASARTEDQAQLSGAHVQAQALAARVAQLPEVRAEKVQSLREALAHGQYRLDAEKIAGALISHMRVQPAR